MVFLIEEEGVALRGLFIINPEGELQYQVVNHNNIGRDVDETLRVLTSISNRWSLPSKLETRSKNYYKIIFN